MNIKLAIAVSGIALGALASPVLADKPDASGNHETTGHPNAHGANPNAKGGNPNANGGNMGGNDNSGNGNGNGKANNPGSQE